MPDPTLTTDSRSTWPILLWLGVLGSILAWASWGWQHANSSALAFVPLVIALGSVVIAWRASRGARWALLLLFVAGLAVLAYSSFFLVLLIVLSDHSPIEEWLVTAGLPSLAALALLLGSLLGLRASRR